MDEHFTTCVHQIIRQQRGILTAVERYVRRQVWCYGSPEGTEVLRRIGQCRHELQEMESWVGKRNS